MGTMRAEPSPHVQSDSFTWPVRVYWEDTDGEGVVYYANYFKFLERARTEWLRSLGVEQGPMKRERGLMFVVVDVEAHYRRPARYGDLLEVTCAVAERTRATLTFEQRIYRDEPQRELVLDGRVRVACVDATTHRPTALPAVVGGMIK
jgi:acyl-CoA thioester hydrolase